MRDGIAKYQKRLCLTSPVSPDAWNASDDGRVVAPTDAPTRHFGVGLRNVGRDPEIADGDERVSAVQQRNAVAHPRQDSGLLEPMAQRRPMAAPERPQLLAT